jgi:hypothetical protein
VSAALRYPLGGLLAAGALAAFAGGFYGMSGAEGVPREWLDGTPFRSYRIPSLILFVVVGGGLFVAAVAVLADWAGARWFAAAGSVVLLGWIGVQVAVIGYVSWLQPATACAGALALVLASLSARPSPTSPSRS